MRYAYIRVSTDKQTTENQKNLIESRGYKIDKWLVDEATTGTSDWKVRSIEQAVNESRPGDEIIVAELSRLGRSLSNVLELVEMCRKKEVVIICIREGIELRDDNPITKLLISIIGSLAEMERNLISQRTKDALARKKEAGVVLGRPKGTSRLESNSLWKKRYEVIGMYKDGYSFSKIARELNSHRITVAKFIKRYEKEIGIWQ